MTIPDALRELADRLAHADRGERFPKTLTAEAVGTLVAAADEVEQMEKRLVREALAPPKDSSDAILAMLNKFDDADKATFNWLVRAARDEARREALEMAEKIARTEGGADTIAAAIAALVVKT